MYTTSDFRRGLRIEFEGQPYVMIDFQHHKPGKGAAVTRTKLKNMLTGQVIDPTFRSGDKVGRPDIEEKDADYLYTDGEAYHFMEPTTGEQYEIRTETMGDTVNFLTDGMTVELLFYQGNPVNIDVPNHVVLTVSECDPAVKGDTVQGATKPAILETGLKVMVPLFINEGDRLKIDTRTSEYTERANA